MPDLGLGERALYHAASALCALPPSVQHALSGGPIVRDGLTLHPELALLFRVGTLRRPPQTAKGIRWVQNLLARSVGGPTDTVVARDLTVEGMRARLYTTTTPNTPLLVFFHGGGFVFGNVDTHDAPCRVLCRHADVNVLSIEYRLAPEHPFPAAVEDTRAAFAWAQAHAAELGADPNRVGVGGDSAGGNLAAVVSQLAARDGGPLPFRQLLVYPAVDRHTAWPSVELFGEGFYLTRESIDWFYAQYANGSHTRDARIHPLVNDDFSGQPPALVVTAGFDPLRDEGEAYARSLREAGNEVTVRRFGDLAHGFFNLVGVSRACRDAVVEIAGATRMLFGGRR